VDADNGDLVEISHQPAGELSTFTEQNVWSPFFDN